MPYFVSRQRYYYSKDCIVEVTGGGLDYAGADMLSPQYPGEGEEYDDPREAVTAAITIRDLWKADGVESEVAVGCTFGMGLELEEGTDEYNLAWAERQWESLEKCDHCGEVIGRETWEAHDLPDFQYCSQNCAERAWEHWQEEMAEIEEGGGELT